MHFGIDFDNTIVSYDVLFHKVACEWELIDIGIPANKVVIRDRLRTMGLEDRWTEMQGHVYGARMDEAEAYPGAIEFITRAIDKGHHVSIVSHKTRWPFIGPPYDLHAAAQAWIDHHLLPQLTSPDGRFSAYFELTKVDKLARIGDCGCTVFIDDLPEILLAPNFPTVAKRLLFDPEAQHQTVTGLHCVNSWQQIASLLALT